MSWEYTFLGLLGRCLELRSSILLDRDILQHRLDWHSPTIPLAVTIFVPRVLGLWYWSWVFLDAFHTAILEPSGRGAVCNSLSPSPRGSCNVADKYFRGVNCSSEGKLVLSTLSTLLEMREATSGQQMAEKGFSRRMGKMLKQGVVFRSICPVRHDEKEVRRYRIRKGKLESPGCSHRDLDDGG